MEGLRVRRPSPREGGTRGVAEDSHKILVCQAPNVGHVMYALSVEGEVVAAVELDRKIEEAQRVGRKSHLKTLDENVDLIALLTVVDEEGGAPAEPSSAGAGVPPVT
jgi:hypothetical protein